LGRAVCLVRFRFNRLSAEWAVFHLTIDVPAENPGSPDKFHRLNRKRLAAMLHFHSLSVRLGAASICEQLGHIYNFSSHPDG
jgi:hypothetical protein